jgi:hypothetical protein
LYAENGSDLKQEIVPRLKDTAPCDEGNMVALQLKAQKSNINKGLFKAKSYARNKKILKN